MHHRREMSLLETAVQEERDPGSTISRIPCPVTGTEGLTCEFPRTFRMLAQIEEQTPLCRIGECAAKCYLAEQRARDAAMVA